jgi:hypothetical protein
VQAAGNQIEFVSPQLPDSIERLQLTDLWVGTGSADVCVRRTNGEVFVDVLRSEGDCQVRVQR